MRETVTASGTSPRGGGGARLLAGVLLFACAASAAADPLAGCPTPVSSVPEQWQGEHVWSALQAAGYTVADIGVVVDGVFDLGNPQEDTWYGHTADALHINTHAQVIRDQLLIQTGQPVDARRVYESERRLRGLPFLRYADIEPVGCNGNTVVVEVHVKDAWSLKFDLNFAHVGGQSSLGASFEDVDFLGTGKTLAVGHQTDVQRISNRITYQDPALLGGRWQLATTYAHLSDGFVRSLDLGQPFYEDRTDWSFFVHYLNQLQDLNFYNLSTVVWRVPDKQQRLEFDWMKLLDWQGDTGTRAGASYITQDYTYGSLESFPPPTLARPVLEDRRFGGVAASFEFFQDRYASFTDLALIGRTEDYNVGWDTTAQAGYDATIFGSHVPAWFYSLNSTYGREFGDTGLLLGSAALQGRRQGGLDVNQLADVVFTYYDQSFSHHTLVAHGEVDYSLRPDPENMQYLGGLQGMPGYPNYFLIGDRRWQAQFSDRIVTDHYLFNTFQLGFAVYTDAGQIREPYPVGWSRTLIDAGVALRLGDIRSAYGGVIYVTYAWPLVKLTGATDRQFVIGNIVNF
ncbi:MAG TPA: hypothetical protein VKT74_06845 [Gammaproteobacteria bacterium]|nr:hypothetical protein [Gammaproteobacteria bacterium]